jgi:hypothetical protein
MIQLTVVEYSRKDINDVFTDSLTGLSSAGCASFLDEALQEKNPMDFPAQELPENCRSLFVGFEEKH